MLMSVSLIKAIVWELCWRIFSFVFRFCKTKGYYWQKCLIDHASQPWNSLLDGFKLTINYKKTMTSQPPDMTSLSILFDVAVLLLSSLVTDSSFMSTSWLFGVMTIFVYKSLNRNPEVGNTSVCVLPNIWRLEQVRDTKFGTNVSNKKLLNTAKSQGYSFYRLPN